MNFLPSVARTQTEPLIGFRVRRTLHKLIQSDHDAARTDSKRLSELVVTFTSALTDIVIDWLTTARGPQDSAMIFNAIGADPGDWFQCRARHEKLVAQLATAQEELTAAKTARGKYSIIFIEDRERDAVATADAAIHTGQSAITLLRADIVEAETRANEIAYAVISAVLANLEVVRHRKHPLAARIDAVLALRADEISRLAASIRQRELRLAESLERAAAHLRNGSAG